MVDVNSFVTLQECLCKLNENKKRYGQKGFDLQVYFVGQMFKMTYDEVVAAMDEVCK